jgi:PiT family inorganic phosphate transporter
MADPNVIFWLAVIAVVIVLFFDYTNGFHDAANIVATIIASRAMTPAQAVVIVGVFEFLGPLLGGTAVANTIGKFITLGDVGAILSLAILICGLLGAIVWNLATWYFGIPSSSSHALIGGFVGAGFAFGGTNVVLWGSLTMPLLGIVLAPTLCLALGYVTMLAILWICRNSAPHSVNRTFNWLQFVAAAVYSISHGGNDAQKTIGLIAALLVGEGYLVPKDAVLAGSDIPYWVVISAFMAITLGTLSGGWRIVKTMGMRITKLRPADGFAAAMAGGVLIIGFTKLGVPVSTTHSIAGSIMGVGATKGLSAVRWGVSANIVWAWILTIPISALISMLTYWICHAVGV